MQIPIYSRFRFGPITDQAPNVKKKGEEKLEGGDKGLGSKKGAKGSKREPAPFSGSNMSSDEDEPAPSPFGRRGGASCEPRSEVDARGVRQR